MKKFIFLAAASLVLLASCEKEKNNGNGPVDTGVVGEWNINSLTLEFRHPDLTSIDLSPVSPELGVMNISDLITMANEKINEELGYNKPFTYPELTLTEDGRFSFIDLEEIPLTYTLDNSTMHIHVAKAVMEGIANEIKAETDIMTILAMLGLEGIVENPQELDIPLQFRISEGNLYLTADQNTTAQFSEMLAPAIETVGGILEALTYEIFSALLESSGMDLAGIITAENFPAIKQTLIDVFTALTDGKAEYSVTTDLVPFVG